MAEISVTFTDQKRGYDKTEVDQFVKEAEAKLQEKSQALADSQHKVEELEAKLAQLGISDSTVEEKLELYEKLMKKMDGDYTNLLAPAIAKAKAIEEKAEAEYAVRIDQARYSADGIYKEAADRIVGVVDSNMERIYGMIDEYIYSKSLIGRIKAFLNGCKEFTQKAVQVPAQAINNASEKIKNFDFPKYTIVKKN